MDANQVIMVTGANTGLGYEIIKALYASDNSYSILLGGRSPQKAEDAVNSAKEAFPGAKSELSSIQIDIESDESIQNAFEEVQTKFGRLDALVNNAGRLTNDLLSPSVLTAAGAQLDQQLSSGRLNMRQMWNQSWDVNVVGTHIMTSVFAPLLLNSSNPRLLFITSGTSTLAGSDNMALPINRHPARGWPKEMGNITAYRSSKTGMNMMMREWHRILKEDGVKVWCISPGMLATGLGGNPEANKAAGAGDPAVAGTFIRDVLQGKRNSDVGKVILRDGVQPW